MPGRRGHDSIAAQSVDIAADGMAAGGDPGQLPGSDRGDGIPFTTSVEHSGFRHRCIADDRGDHPDRLAGRVEELRPRPGHGPGHGHRYGRAAVRRRRWWWRPVIHHRRALGDLQELAIEFGNQIPVERELGRPRDTDTDHRQQRHLPREQSSSQRPRPRARV